MATLIPTSGPMRKVFPLDNAQRFSLEDIRKLTSTLIEQVPNFPRSEIHDGRHFVFGQGTGLHNCKAYPYTGWYISGPVLVADAEEMPAEWDDRRVRQLRYTPEKTWDL